MSLPEPLTLDVRSELAGGREPFGAIMAATDSLAPGQPLRLIAPFRPVPLFNVMVNRGFSVSDHRRDDGAWEVLFTPDYAPPPADLAPGSAPGAVFWPDPALALDLTGLPPSESVRRILECIDGMAEGEVLFALLDRAAESLLPELAMRHHEWAGNAATDGSGYRLLIRKGAAD